MPGSVEPADSCCRGVVGGKRCGFDLSDDIGVPSDGIAGRLVTRTPNAAGCRGNLASVVRAASIRSSAAPRQATDRLSRPR